MKKLIYLLLILPLLFISCSKDDDNSDNNSDNDSDVTGCMDSDAVNYDDNATINEGCMYDISGAVWGMIEQEIDGVDVMQEAYALYLWENGDFGWEEYITFDEDYTDYGGGPGIGTWGTSTSGGNNTITLDDGDEFNNVTFTVDEMDDNDNMTLRITNNDGQEMKTVYVRSEWSIDDWK